MPELLFDLSGRRVFVAGHRGMVGQALVRRLASEGCTVLTAPRERVDLTRQAEVEAFFATEKPDAVFVAAARVGGILANDSRPWDFLQDNLLIETNVIGAALAHKVAKLMFLGSSCIYPRLAPQPISEDSLLTGPLEPTNQWYAIAKIAGIMLCDAARRQHGADFISAMPTNLYGPGDNYDLASSHVVPALLRKAHEAKLAGRDHIEVWGTGTALREFLHVDDCADALVFLMKHWSGEGPVNVGSGSEISIGDLARLVMKVVGLTGEPRFDTTKPDGTPRKLMDGSRLAAMGWRPRVTLEEGLRGVYADAPFGAAGPAGTGVSS
jgi:GDP-L-fucose synthase